MFYILEETRPLVRYDLATFVEHVASAKSYDFATSFFIKEVPKLSVFGIFDVRGEEARPDLISYKLYGHTQYWWVLLLFNNFTSFQEIETGTNLNYPSLISVESLFFRLRSILSSREQNKMVLY